MFAFSTFCVTTDQFYRLDIILFLLLTLSILLEIIRLSDKIFVLLKFPLIYIFFNFRF